MVGLVDPCVCCLRAPEAWTWVVALQGKHRRGRRRHPAGVGLGAGTGAAGVGAAQNGSGGALSSRRTGPLGPGPAAGTRAMGLLRGDNDDDDDDDDGVENVHDLEGATCDSVEPRAGRVGNVIRGAGYTLDLSSLAFEAYYQMQAIVGEGEWEAFMAALRRPLPVTLRINALDASAGRWVDGRQWRRQCVCDV